jgi:hypothetical protein
MEPNEARRAIEAGIAAASELGLHTTDAVVIYSSGRMVARLMPCDVLARIGPSAHEAGNKVEVDVARRLAEVGAPVGALDPRVKPLVYTHADFAITLWTYYKPVGVAAARSAWRLTDVETAAIVPADYADSLARLHASFREIDLDAPHLADRVAACAQELDNEELPSDLPAADRELLCRTLRDLTPVFTSTGIHDQLLHGEPHPGNVLSTSQGPLFVDLGGCCRGPVEFDLAHTPPDVAAHYPGTDRDLLRQCRILMWVFLSNCRWWRDDQLPNREYWRTESLNRLRAAIADARS